MRKHLIAAASALALLSGGAMAQTTVTTTDGTMTTTPSAGATAVDHLIGKTVYGTGDEKLGTVDDVLLDSTGKATQLVVSSGGFLGIGERKVAIPYNDAQWNPDREELQVAGLTAEQIKTMPEFEMNDTMTAFNRNRAGSKTDIPPASPGAAPGAAPSTTPGTPPTGTPANPTPPAD